jgi:outer membrane protein assembly factor BamB
VASVSEATVGFDPRTGSPPAWATPRTDTADPFHYEPVSIANGVAYILNADGSLMALDERDGTPLLVRNIDSDDGGQDAFVGIASSGVAIARHTVYVAAGHHVVAYRAS